MSFDLQKNADRFSGFADIYNDARPKCPQYVVERLTRYLGRKPETVIDLGCGTGSSTVVWSDYCDNVTGIDPSEDMLKVAIQNSKDYKNITYKKAFANDTGLDGNIADIITCSQSFHWMEPESTLKEVSRLLKTGGVFAAYDCDWPPFFKWETDSAFLNLLKKINEFEISHPKYSDSFKRWHKSNHFTNIINSNLFGFVREVVFQSGEIYSAERYISTALSQASLQMILRDNEHLIKSELDNFINIANEVFKDEEYEVDYCYRMRIGVK